MAAKFGNTNRRLPLPVIDKGVAYYGIQTGGFFALKLPTFSQVQAPASSIYVKTDKNTEVTFPISGNITGSQISNYI